MQNFRYYNPVKVLFGRGQISRMGREIPPNARVFLTFGGGSIKSNGVHAQVREALGDRHVTEFGGIEPNPRYETLMRAVDQLRADEHDFLLAVGGGSVLDGTKFLAAAVNYGGDPWELLTRPVSVQQALPLGAVMTLPATGSEMNGFAVITREASHEKLAFGSELLYPRFSVLDPATTLSLPARQIGNGIVDAFVHVMEQYLTFPADAPLQDRMAEAILLTLREVGPRTLANPQDYEARASFMWCATMALNGIIAVGVPQDWATHGIGHELTALHGLDHGQSLAVVLPSLMEERLEAKRAKLLQYAERIWGLTEGSEEDRLAVAIVRTRGFFEEVGVPTRLSAYGVGHEAIPPLVAHLEERGPVELGERGDIDAAAVGRILVRSA